MKWRFCQRFAMATWHQRIELWTTGVLRRFCMPTLGKVYYLSKAKSAQTKFYFASKPPRNTLLEKPFLSQKMLYNSTITQA